MTILPRIPLFWSGFGDLPGQDRGTFTERIGFNDYRAKLPVVWLVADLTTYGKYALW